MRSFRALAPVGALLFVSGCGYIHFGRLPRSSDEALQKAYSDLSLEHKILKQELVIAHQETDSLRAALEKAGATAAPTSELATQLEKTSEELATLRANYAKLQAERSAASAKTGEPSAEPNALRAENARLRRELDESKQNNATLADQLKQSVERNEQAQSSLTQLNADLLDQKIARERAEKAVVALRAQLEAVMARAGRAGAAAPEISAATTPAIGQTKSPLSALQNAKAPPSGAVPVVELRTSLDRARAAAATASPPEAPSTAAPVIVPPVQATTAASAAPPASTRTYTVQAGDTLEKIAVKVYGAADQWGKIYAANAEALGSSQGLKAGMKLVVPE